MSTEIQLDTKGLDEAGKSVLTWPDLTRHMASAEVLSIFDTALAGFAFESARLSIRREGTFIVFSNRDSDLGQALESIADLIDAMANSAVNPGAAAAAQLKTAEKAFDESTLICIQRAIRKACRSEEMELKFNMGTRKMRIRLPHKSILSPKRKHADPTPDGDQDRIQKILPYIDAISSSGQGMLIMKGDTTPAIKAGDRIIVKIRATARRFLRLNDAEPSKEP